MENFERNTSSLYQCLNRLFSQFAIAGNDDFPRGLINNIINNKGSYEFFTLYFKRIHPCLLQFYCSSFTDFTIFPYQNFSCFRINQITLDSVTDHELGINSFTNCFIFKRYF